jgi:hypothetical protein
VVVGPQYAVLVIAVGQSELGEDVAPLARQANALAALPLDQSLRPLAPPLLPRTADLGSIPFDHLSPCS